MLWRLLLLLIRIPVFSAVSSAVVALASTGQTVVFPIDANQRGTDLLSMFNSFSRSTGQNYPQFILQTNLPSNNNYLTYRYLQNGMIPYVQSITATTYNTLLIIGYITPSYPSMIQYIVLPPENVIDLLYFSSRSYPPTSNTAFTSTYSSSTLPFFSVDQKQRAADILSAWTQLKNLNINSANTTQVWFQTTLNGPFNPTLIYNGTPGLVRNVTNITVTNSLLNVTFKPTGQTIAQTIILAPEQVQQIIYVFNYNSP